jgi:ferrochelatase
MITNTLDAVMLLGFGGPTHPSQIQSFLSDVLRGKEVPEQRRLQVLHQYELIGGVSPYNPLITLQAQKLHELLKARGIPKKVLVALAHSEPSVYTTLKLACQQQLQKLFVIIMAPFQSPASFEKYQLKIEEALNQLKKENYVLPQIILSPPWYRRPGFIHTWKQNIEIQLQASPARSSMLVFTTHSIPLAMAEQCPYVSQYRETAQMIAQFFPEIPFELTYQSRSGKPSDPWLTPDIGDFFKTQNPQTHVWVAPIGFLIDHVEVLYDLDILVQKRAQELDLEFHRIQTPGIHPSFIATLASLVEEILF